MKKKKDWFSLKGYPHIGLPMEYNDINLFKSYIKDPINISKHSFLPLIHRKTSKRKFRKEYSKVSGLLLNEGERVVMNPKERELYYSVDIDANIFSYYAHLLSLKYEAILKERNLTDIPSAYRRIPLNLNDDKLRNKCNVDFADEVFTYIIDHKEENLVAIAFDISSFFDNLDHKLLKRVWCEVLGTKCLSDDHYKVFKAITNYSFVEESDLFNEFRDDIFVKNSSRDIKRKKINRSKYLKNQKAIAYCARNDFKKRILGKITIKTNNKKRVLGQKGKYKYSGIPQGSPISAVLANVYMLNFDEEVNSKINSLGGIYRRYSDDMIVVCSRKYKADIIKLFKQEITKYSLDIKDEKTQVFHFVNRNKKMVCYEEVMNEKKSNDKKNEIGYCTPNTNLAYLGFEFDGESARLKSASLSQHTRKMKRSVRRCGFYASHSEYKGGHGKMFIRRLYKRFSHLGATRRMIYVRNKKNPSKFHKSKKHDWGNYLTYTNMAINNMNCPNVISNQVKRQWRYLNEEIKMVKKKNGLQ